MGSEQSQHANAAAAQARVNNQSRLQRGHTIAVSGRRLSNDEAAANQVPTDSRPSSPPVSVCSDSDLPYVSYTDRLGGWFSVTNLYANYSQLPNTIIKHSHLRFAKATRQRQRKQ